MSPFVVFILTVSVLLHCNFHPVAAAVLATIRSQDGGSKKTYFLEPIRPSATNTSRMVLITDGLKSASPVGELEGSTILPSSKSVDSPLLRDQFQQKSRQEKPSLKDINVIFDDASLLALSTEAPSTTTLSSHHYATTVRSMDERLSISDPFRPKPTYQFARKTINYELNKDSKSIWLLDEEEDKDNEEWDEYEVVDLSQPSRLPVIDLSVTSNDELDGKGYSNQFEEEYENYPSDDTILVIEQLSTLSPFIYASERQDGIEVPTQQFHEEENKSAHIAGLSEWPVQIGLQARSKSSLATKPIETPTDNLNEQQMTAGTQESSNQQQLKYFQTEVNGNQHNNGVASYAGAHLNFDEKNDKKSSNPVSFRPQFMHSPVAKTISAQTRKTLVEMDMTNHYGNSNGGKPTQSVTSATRPTPEPEKSNYHVSSQEDRTQEASMPAKPDEPFYYHDSEEETDHDISLDYTDEEIIKPTTAGINTPGTVSRQSPPSMSRPPYFVSSLVAPFQQRMVQDNDFELLKPIELVGNRMNIEPKKGITFVDDAIQPMFLLPFPVDHVLMNQPDSVVEPQPLMSTASHPVGEIDASKRDSFPVNYNHSLPSVQSQNTGSSIPSKETGVTIKFPYISIKIESEEKDLKDLVYEKPRIGYSVQEEPKKPDEIKPLQMKTNNIKIHEDHTLTTIHQDELPSLKTLSSSTQIKSGTFSQPTRPMAAFKSNADDIIVTSHPRPFVQAAYVTRSRNKAGSGPYFVSSVESNYRRNSYLLGDDMTRPLMEYDRRSAAKRHQEIIHRSTPSASAGRPPYFVTSQSATTLHSMNLNDPTPKPTSSKIEDENSDRSLLSHSSHAPLQPTSSEAPTFAQEQSTTTQIPIEREAGRQSDNSDVSFGPVRPTLPYILTRLNAAQPIQSFYPSSAVSNVTERILNIDLPTEEGMKLTIGSFPSPIGISNKNNVFVVPKQTEIYTAQKPVHSSTVPTFLSTNKPGSSNRNNQRESTTGTIVNHYMGSFIATSSPIRSSKKPTYTSRPATVATTPTIKGFDIIDPIKSEEKNHKIDIDYTEQEKSEKPDVVVKNPIGISNKDNVFVVPKTVKGIIQPLIRRNRLSADTLMKRQNSSTNGEQHSSTMRPFKRKVSHQMGSFLVTSGPHSIPRIPNTAVRKTIMPTGIPGIVARSPTERAELAQQPYLAKDPTYEITASNKRKMGKSEQITRSRTGSSNSGTSRIGHMAQSTITDQSPVGQLPSNRSIINRRKQQQPRTLLQDPNRRSGYRSIVTATPRPSTESSSSSKRKRKNTVAKTKRNKTTASVGYWHSSTSPIEETAVFLPKK